MSLSQLRADRRLPAFQTLKDLEEGIAMVKDDDSKKKPASSKPKKEKEVKEKDKEKEGLFGLFHHKKGMLQSSHAPDNALDSKF